MGQTKEPASRIYVSQGCSTHQIHIQNNGVKTGKKINQYHGFVFVIILDVGLPLCCRHVFDLVNCNPQDKHIFCNINTYVCLNIVPWRIKNSIKNLSYHTCHQLDQNVQNSLEFDLLWTENIKLKTFYELNIKLRTFWTVNEVQSLFETTLVFAVFLSQINFLDSFIFRSFFFLEIKRMKLVHDLSSEEADLHGDVGICIIVMLYCTILVMQFYLQKEWQYQKIICLSWLCNFSLEWNFHLLAKPAQRTVQF